MKHFTGIRGLTALRVNYAEEAFSADYRPLPLHNDLVNAGESFDWGVISDGARQLSFAILAECVGPFLAQQHYQVFAWKVIAALPHEHFGIHEDMVRAWVNTGLWGYDFIKGTRALPPGIPELKVERLDNQGLKVLMHKKLKALQVAIAEANEVLEKGIERGVRP